MRFQQLVMDAGPSEVTLTFHPRLTVIAGLGRKEREGVIGELLGIMAGVRRNTRLDLLDDAGRHLSVRRAGVPEQDKVVNLDNAHEVSLEFLNGGRVDLLHALGLDMERARRRWRLSQDDMSEVSNGETLVASLATRNQRQLWAAAERVRAAEIRLAEETEPVGSTADDVTTNEEVERRHNSFEAAQGRYEAVRIFGLFLGGFCVVAGASALVAQRWTGTPLLGVAGVIMVIALLTRKRMLKARHAERQGLAEAGAGSYVGFHMQRIAERLDRHEDRPSLKAAAAERREATVAWQGLAGGVSADWAFAMRDQIAPAADRLAGGGRLRSPVGGAGRGQTSPAELAEALMIRLADLRHVGPDGESCPLILDEPLVGIELPVKQWMLELVARTAGSPQVVYLTGDSDVAAWARIEALAGQLEVIGPGAPLDVTAGGETPSLMQANGAAGSSTGEAGTSAG